MTIWTTRHVGWVLIAIVAGVGIPSYLIGLAYGRVDRQQELARHQAELQSLWHQRWEAFAAQAKAGADAAWQEGYDAAEGEAIHCAPPSAPVPRRARLAQVSRDWKLRGRLVCQTVMRPPTSGG